MRPATATSLGDLLQRAGVVDAATLESLVAALRDRLRKGTPTSLGRILLERGIPSTRILAVATSGERPPAIRCDACSTVQPLSGTPHVREFPCTRCGAFLLPLGPAVEGRGDSTIIDAAVMPIPSVLTPGFANPEPNDDTTMPLGTTSPLSFRTTGRFDEILSVPSETGGDTSGGTTHNFNKVLPIPGSRPVAVPSSLPGTEDATVSLPASSAPLPLPGAATSGPVGIPPNINAWPNARPGNARPGYAPPGYASPAPPYSTPQPFSLAASAAPGIPPVLQDARLQSSGLRRPPPALPGVSLDTESPTVADAEGSGGAFSEATTAAAVPATPAGSRSTASEQRSPLAGSREQPRARSGRQDKKKPASNGVIVFLAFAATLFVIGLAALAVVLFKYLQQR